MKKAGFITVLVLFVIFGGLPSLAQSGKVERKRNLFGTYKYRQDGRKFSERAFMQEMPVSSDAYKLMRTARKYNAAGNILGISGGILAISQLSLRNNGNAYSREVLFTGIGLFAIGLPFSLKYVKQSGLATDLYNETIAKSSSATGKAEIQVGFVGNGAGLQVNF